MNWPSVIKNLKRIVTAPKHLAIMGLTSIVFFLALVILQNASTLRSFSNSQGFLAALSLAKVLILGFHQTVTPLHYTTLIILSILIGVVLTLILYRRNIHQESSKDTGVISTLGAGLGIIAPGCAACSLGVLPVLGLTTGSFFAILPFEGLEFSFLSIILLTFSIFKLASFDESCPIPKKK